MERILLKGSPRIHYDNLQLVEDDDGEDIVCADGKPFTGIAWSELQGIQTEDSLKNGLKNGRCVMAYFDGTLAEDGIYKEGWPVGVIRKYFESGEVSSVCEYDNDSNTISEKEYNSAGVLVKEVIEKPQWKLSFWTNDGILIYASDDCVARCHYGDSICVVENKRTRKSEFYDEQLFCNAYNMLSAELGLVTYPVFNWLNKKLDEGNIRAKSLLFALVDHPKVSITESALFIIENRGYKESIPLVRNLIQSKRKKSKDEGGFVGTTSELAERVFRKLVKSTNIFTRFKTYKYLKEVTEKRKRFAKRRDAQEKKRATVMQRWPVIEATLKETIFAESTLKTGEQIFANEVMQRDVVYMYVYEYKIQNCTYRAVYTCKQSPPSNKKMLHYREKKPHEYVFCD